MRIEKLNSDKIKVTLTTAELVTLDIDVDRLSPNSKELHSFLFHIMDTIHKETGFNPYSGQVVVEATPSKEGISLIVHRLGSRRRVTREDFKKANRVTARLKAKTTDTLSFYFDRFEDLCAAMTEMTEEALGDSCLYKIDNLFCFTMKDTARHAKCVHIMLEFSSDKTLDAHFTYIREHGSLVAEGSELIQLRKNIRNLI